MTPITCPTKYHHQFVEILKEMAKEGLYISTFKANYIELQDDNTLEDITILGMVDITVK